jgi:hypothetical protein
VDHERIIAARNYIRRIKKPAKQAYARANLDYMLSSKQEPERGELSEMGAQAVRITLVQLLGKEEP